MTLGEKITKQRKELNHTQEQLADILAVSRQSVSKWESDIAYPETEKLIAMGKLFDCSMDYLLIDEITDKSGKNTCGLGEKFRKTVMTQSNKDMAKKICKIIVIILTAILIIDLISMLVYFCIYGLLS